MTRTTAPCAWSVAILIATVGLAPAGDDTPPAPVVDTSRGDALLAEYFRLETERIEGETFAGIDTLEDWTSQRDESLRQLREMLGLDPLPEKTPLQPVVTGTVDHPEFTVEKLHFQSLPELYVTANLYVPKGITGKAPTVLYVCGHARMRDGERSLGNKTGYQHHGEWFARHGYVCLTIDSLQLGEVEGIHHGTRRYGRWWWNSRGYTPAGVEAWNCIRALDYLETREEVDTAKIGVAGRSGGGAYSWWIAALDERIACAVPVAGITTLKNHVVDGCVTGHCDCMFMVNTYGWDYARVAALVAPRPLLISNTDKDKIFPLDGVVDVYEQVRNIYRLYGAEDKLGLQITEGPHMDTQELHIHEFVWMNKHLKGENPTISVPAEKLFDPKQLRVFEDLPSPERNSTIDETFVPAAPQPPVPQDAEEWASMRDRWLRELREKCFRAWPPDSPDVALTLDVADEASGHVGDYGFSLYEFTSQHPYRLPLIALNHDEQPERVVVKVLTQAAWEHLQETWQSAFPEQFIGPANNSPASIPPFWEDSVLQPDTLYIWTVPRGIGPTEWTRDEGERTQIRRRFMLLGQTADSARVYDVRRAIQAARQIAGPDVPVSLHAEGDAAAWALYASLFEPDVAELSLISLPASHRDGPDFLNVLRILDIPQAVALAAQRSSVTVFPFAEDGDWQYPLEVAGQLGWDEERLRISDAPLLDPIEESE